MPLVCLSHLLVHRAQLGLLAKRVDFAVGRVGTLQCALLARGGGPQPGPAAAAATRGGSRHG